MFKLVLIIMIELHLDWKVNDQCLASWHDLFAAPLLLAGTPTLLTLKGDRGAWSCYSARGGGGSALDRIDLAGLAADATEVVHLSCCKCVSSLLESASHTSLAAVRRDCVSMFPSNIFPRPCAYMAG